MASSLVMLSAIPLLNNNINAAMAQGYDIYRENSYYSQYPTDDKKYECRTGPFEGFFVSSVEFCKFINLIKMIEKTLRTIEREVKDHLVHKVHKEFKALQVLQEQLAHQVLLN